MKPSAIVIHLMAQLSPEMRAAFASVMQLVRAMFYGDAAALEKAEKSLPPSMALYMRESYPAILALAKTNAHLEAVLAFLLAVIEGDRLTVEQLGPAIDRELVDREGAITQIRQSFEAVRAFELRVGRA